MTEGTTYVQPFPPTGSKHLIAQQGGRPLWSRDGKELFFVPAPGRFMVVAVKTAPIFTVTSPVEVPRGFGAAAPTRSAHVRHHARRPDCRRRHGRPEPKRIAGAGSGSADSSRAELVRGAEVESANEVVSHRRGPAFRASRRAACLPRAVVFLPWFSVHKSRLWLKRLGKRTGGVSSPGSGVCHGSRAWRTGTIRRSRDRAYRHHHLNLRAIARSFSTRTGGVLCRPRLRR